MPGDSRRPYRDFGLGQAGKHRSADSRPGRPGLRTLWLLGVALAAIALVASLRAAGALTSGSPHSRSSAGSASASAGRSRSAASSPRSLAPEPPAALAGFAPYVDTSLDPPFDLTGAALRTGVRQFNLGFVVAAGGSGCVPGWAGLTATLGANSVAVRITALRALGGDAAVSFGGKDGAELARTCTSAAQLTAAYQRVISAYRLDEIDFDVEGAALSDTAANSRRDEALAALQARDRGLRVSFTLPVLPSGLTRDGINLLTRAHSAGVQISAVDVLAMDFGDGNAPNPTAMMGTYVIRAATATDAQVAGLLGISKRVAWTKIAVTPMIGVNDQRDEVFTLSDARKLAAFAARKHLAWISMWSVGRDRDCVGGASYAGPACSGITQPPYAFMKTLRTY